MLIILLTIQNTNLIPGVYLDFLTRGGWSQCLGGSRPNQFCKFAVVGHTYYMLYIVMCDINMTTFDTTWLWGVECFRGITSPYGVTR